jgi:hypothetical protein
MIDNLRSFSLVFAAGRQFIIRFVISSKFLRIMSYGCDLLLNIFAKHFIANVD